MSDTCLECGGVATVASEAGLFCERCDELVTLRRERAEAREGWREAARWLRRLAGIEAMPYWVKTEPWLFEEVE